MKGRPCCDVDHANTAETQHYGSPQFVRTPAQMVVAVMDEGEVVMRAGDVLIQRGTNHAWSNRSGKPARIAFVLIDGKATAT